MFEGLDGYVIKRVHIMPVVLNENLHILNTVAFTVLNTGFYAAF